MNFPIVAETSASIQFNAVVVFVNNNTGIVVCADDKSPYKIGDLKNTFNSVTSSTWNIIEGDISRYIDVVKNIAKDRSRELDLINLALK